MGLPERGTFLRLNLNWVGISQVEVNETHNPVMLVCQWHCSLTSFQGFRKRCSVLTKYTKGQPFQIKWNTRGHEGLDLGTEPQQQNKIKVSGVFSITANWGENIKELQL